MPDTKTQPPAPRPCASCPYRRDVPSGIWAAEEYAKLPRYDADTMHQPPGVFMCHQVNGRICGGWAGCHDGTQLLGLRIAAMRGAMTGEDIDATIGYVSPVPLFASGAKAAAHGMAQIRTPGRDAVTAMTKITRTRASGRAFAASTQEVTDA